MRKRLFFLVSIISGLFMPVEAFSSESLRTEGYIKAFLFERLTEPYDFERAGASLQLCLQGESGRLAAYYASVNFELDSRLAEGSALSDRGDGFSIYPVEIFIDLSSGPFEARFGKQYILWGPSVWMGPTDIISPWDYDNMAAEIENYRIAPLGARLGWYPSGDLHVDFVWLPVFRPNRLGFTPPEEIMGLPVDRLPPSLPPDTPLKSEFGLRISRTISKMALDLALLGYRGFDKMPVFELVPVMGEENGQPISFLWNESYEELSMIGADLSKATGPFVFIAETAFRYAHKIDDQKDASYRIEYVAGIDTIITENYDFGLQYVGGHYFSEIRDTNNEHPAFHSFSEEKTTHALSLRLRGKLSSNTGVQGTGFYSFTYRDFFLMAFGWWNIADAVEARAGIVGFGGKDDDTPYSRNREQSRAFIELKYSF